MIPRRYVVGYHAAMPSREDRSRPEGTRRLGRAGFPVSAVGLGLAALGRPAYITLGHAGDLGPDRSVEALRDLTHAVLDAAYAAGVRYFDAARSYGRAEEFLASWLAERDISDRKSTRLNSSHANISYAVFCLKKKKISTPLTPIRRTTRPS